MASATVLCACRLHGPARSGRQAGSRRRQLPKPSPTRHVSRCPVPAGLGWGAISSGVLRSRAVLPQQASRERGSVCSATSSVNTSTDFDLQVAIVLAGAAFEAYNEPVGGKMFVERTVNNTETTYVDRVYMQKRFSGYLKIHLKGAKDLPARDLWGTSDPYVTLSIGDNSTKSKTIPRCLNPQWDETFLMFVKDPEQDRLKIRLFDEDLIGSDDSLGVAFVPLAAFAAGEETNLDVPLSGDGGGGTLSITAVYQPLTESEFDSAFESASLKPVEGTPMKVLDAWTELSGLVSDVGTVMQLERLEPVCYVDNLDSDTQAWILVNREQRHVCVAFRGTEQTKLQDIVTDLNFVPVNLDNERTGGKMFDRDSPQVHNGFLSSFDSVKMKVTSIVDSIITQEDPIDSWTLYITGHSLGGALATIFAEHAASRRWAADGLKPHVSMYNYGSPRLGNSKFVERYNSLVPDSWRVFNKNDIVSSVPRMGNYKHIDNAVAVTAEGGLEVYGDHGIKDVLGEGTSVEDVVPELLRKGLDMDTNDELKALVEQELEILAQLSSGQGIAEHLEDFYLKAFEAIIGGIAKGVQTARAAAATSKQSSE